MSIRLSGRYRVYDKTALDYALRIDGELRLFVEAKAVTKQLDDRAFISQTVNYANNEGVVWCVLTNGVAYRVYKTNEPVAMEDKLLFEVDFTEGSTNEVARALQLLSRRALANGDLEAWGERVFTDNRVRQALGVLAAKPPPDLIALLSKALGKPEVSADRLQESLTRIIDVGAEGGPAGHRARCREGKEASGETTAAREGLLTRSPPGGQAGSHGRPLRAGRRVRSQSRS
jgi:hypothetical protein